jgi:glycerate dehydrogenase
LLALVRKLDQYHHASVDGHWMASEQFCVLDYPMSELRGKVMGIVGYGELGKAVAQVAKVFGMKVMIAQRPGSTEIKPGRVILDELLSQVDVLSLHCPLDENTRGLIGVAELSKMKPTAILINTARGGIVDEEALAVALRDGKLGGVGIDVLHEEPPRHGNVLLDPEIPNLIVTPHVAWASRESRQRLVDEVVENIRVFLSGGERNVV